MQKSLSDKQVRLSVRSHERLSEIFLVNSRFEKIAAAVGYLETSVHPGLYKARFRIGQTQVDQLIEVHPGAEVLEIDGIPVDFSSPVPLVGINTGQEKQELYRNAAETISRSDAEKKGEGAWLFLCIREIAEFEAAPWTGVTLHDLEGSLIAEPGLGICDQENGYFALHLEVNPGTYRLRVEEEPGEFYEIFVRTVAGWQTQVFAVSEAAWLPDVADDHRAVLPSVAVLMVEAGQGFDGENETSRQVELLRLGLLHGRQVVTETVLSDLLKQEHLNPMQVILVAHSLSRQGKLDVVLLTALLKKLPAECVEHPDIQALMLNKLKDERPAFSAPPMLRTSWDRIVKAVEQRKAIVPPGSLAAQLADGVIKTSLWLVHRPDRLEVEKEV
uniref:hypothetical protein n=1 Tax=Candidatus Electrothrix sp. TaxID=2170559 RepID=UPI0040577F4F